MAPPKQTAEEKLLKIRLKFQAEKAKLKAQVEEVSLHVKTVYFCFDATTSFQTLKKST
jgi:hypothetical protein